MTNVQFKQQQETLVVEGDGSSLLGRDWLYKIKLDWLYKIKLDWHELYHTQVLPFTLDKRKKNFNDEIGTVKEAASKFHIDPQTMPKFYKP